MAAALWAVVAALAAPPSPPVCAIDPPAQCPWYNSSLSFTDRVDLLLKALTPSEKLNVLLQQSVARLRVVSDGFNEALHGVAWAGRATVFPCPMALAATFNTSLLLDVGTAVGKEALAKHWGDHSNALSFFAPNINIVRDVRWGRAQETYGEDPTLTGELGAAYVNGMQFLEGGEAGPKGRNAGATAARPPLATRNVAKHFAAYNLESNFAGRVTPAELAKGDGQYRLSYDAPVSPTDMLQTFLPAFESIIHEGRLRGVMCAYNSVDGTPLCANDLLQTGSPHWSSNRGLHVLRDYIGFDGVVITDCGAIGFMTNRHHWNHTDGTPYTPLEATAASLRAGTDLNCGGAFGDHLSTAYEQKLITGEQLDKAAGRVLMGYFELGLFEDSETAAADSRRRYPMAVVDGAEHRALAKQSAIEGVVLLKNAERTLPLGRRAPTPASPSGEGRRLLGRRPWKLAVLGPNANRTLTLTSSYSGCKEKAGGPILPSCTFINPLQGLSAAAKASSHFDDEVLYAAGTDIDTPDTSGIASAVTAAREADVAVVVLGLITCQEIGDECQEAEARDRSTPINADGTDNPFSKTDIGRDYGIGLPGQQLALLQTLANSTSATIVLVIMSGSAVAVTWAAASPRVSAIVQVFYPGVLGGEALADVLMGHVAPSGRLPIMIPTSEAQLPKDYLDQSMQAGQGRTHRYFQGVPLYPFGFGLGYSTFSYSDLTLSHTELPAGTAASETVLTLTLTLTNHGEFAGCSDETVLVFATPCSQGLELQISPCYVPRQVLLGFRKVRTEAGKTTRVEIVLPVRRLRLVGPHGTTQHGHHKGEAFKRASGAFGLLRGRYELRVGGQGEGVGTDSDVAGGKPLTASLYVR